jgi:hypothetical protein
LPWILALDAEDRTRSIRFTFVKVRHVRSGSFHPQFAENIPAASIAELSRFQFLLILKSLCFLANRVAQRPREDAISVVSLLESSNSPATALSKPDTPRNIQ